MPFLKVDISSYRNVLYARAGTEVKIITKHDHVIIVEAPDKNKFPVTADQITSEVENHPIPPVEISNPVKKPTVKRTTKKQISNQTNLF